MVNVYVMRDDLETPPDFTEIHNKYHERLIELGGTPLNFEGSASHSHDASINSVAEAPSVVQGNFAYYSQIPSRITGPHSHQGKGTITDVSKASNFPGFVSVRLVGRSVYGWNQRLPAGSIVFSEKVPGDWTPAKTMLGFAESLFLKISNKPLERGGGVHSHHVTGQTEKEKVVRPRDAFSSGGSAIKISLVEHAHRIDCLASGEEYDYPFWGCGLIKATAETVIPKNVYLLFDGILDPAHWEVVSEATNRYLKYTPGPVVLGGSGKAVEHGHLVEIESDISDACTSNLSSSSPTVLCDHKHKVALNLGPTTTEPPSFRLVLARAKHSMGQGARSYFVMTT